MNIKCNTVYVIATLSIMINNVKYKLISVRQKLYINNNYSIINIILATI